MRISPGVQHFDLCDEIKVNDKLSSISTQDWRVQDLLNSLVMLHELNR